MRACQKVHLRCFPADSLGIEEMACHTACDVIITYVHDFQRRKREERCRHSSAHNVKFAAQARFCGLAWIMTGHRRTRQSVYPTKHHTSCVYTQPNYKPTRLRVYLPYARKTTCCSSCCCCRIPPFVPWRMSYVRFVCPWRMSYVPFVGCSTIIRAGWDSSLQTPAFIV